MSTEPPSSRRWLDYRRKRFWGAALVLVAWRAQAQDQPRIIPVTAKKFTYEPNEIHLKVGEVVVLELRSLDVVMGFNSPDLKVRTDILPGKVTRLELKPDKAGTFPIVCSHHKPSMVGELIVLPTK